MAPLDRPQATNGRWCRSSDYMDDLARGAERGGWSGRGRIVGWLVAAKREEARPRGTGLRISAGYSTVNSPTMPSAACGGASALPPGDGKLEVVPCWMKQSTM